MWRTREHAANAVRIPCNGLEAAVFSLLAFHASMHSLTCFAVHLMVPLEAAVVIRAGACVRRQRLLPKIAEGWAARLSQPALAPRCSPATLHVTVMPDSAAKHIVSDNLVTSFASRSQKI